MATTKRTTSRKSTAQRRPAASPSTKSSGTKSRSSVKRSSPYVTAAVATGAVAAIAAAAASVFFFRKSDQSLGETADELSSRIKDGIADVKSRAKDKAAIFFGDKPADQVELSKQALEIKHKGPKTTHPLDDTIESEVKTGAISY